MATADGSDLVWIFGSPRSGSTWLMKLLRKLSGGIAVDEPMIGNHLTPLVNADRQVERPGYFFSAETADIWRPLLGQLLEARLTAGAEGRTVIVKEPNGSCGAPLLMEALPGSRMVLLLRDGRDVIDSLIDANSGGWLDQWVGGRQPPRPMFIARQANRWVENTQASLTAYAALPEAQRLLLRYEDLLADTAGELTRVAEHFGFTGNPAAVAERFASEGIAEEHRGAGKFYRAATPGLWREHFEPDEVAAMHKVMGPLLEELGYPL